jgi:2-polyprenyl-3-methyl-5-hydroxy-6-metoxy-1,4-benzoquinol methylase
MDQHNALQRQYYEERSERQNWRMLPDTSPYVENHVDRVIDCAQLHKDDLILDIGCGMGKFTLPLARRGFRMEGLDLSPVLLEELSKRNPTQAEVPTHCADVLYPPTHLKDRFDKVTGFFMLHHLVDIEAAFRQVRTLLKHDGKVVFLDVNPYCALYYFQIFLSPSMRWKAERGMLNLTPKKLVSSLQAADFKNVAIRRYGILPPPLRNRSFGPALDNLFDKIPFSEPVAAFQLISADRA